MQKFNQVVADNGMNLIWFSTAMTRVVEFGETVCHQTNGGRAAGSQRGLFNKTEFAAVHWWLTRNVGLEAEIDVLTIRAEQFRVLEDACREQFHRRMMAAILQLLPDLPERAPGQLLYAFVGRHQTGPHVRLRDRTGHLHLCEFTAIFGEGSLELQPRASAVLLGAGKAEELLDAVETLSN